MTQQTIHSVFKAQQAYKYTLRTTNAAQRINKLQALKQCIEKHEHDIYAALLKDLRKSRFEAAVTELIFIYSEIDFAIKHLRDWMKPKYIGKAIGNFFAKNRLYYEPKGVCLIISPWNYPFQLLIAPLISAIAAGNCAILKPSELSSETSGVIAIIIAACFEKQEVCCFEGDASVSTALLALPFDHIFFTGSTAVGKIVMEAASKNLSSVTLELGGKSPAIIDSTANIKKAAQKIAWGKLMNAGQTCIAPDYVFIPTELQEAFIVHYKESVEKMFFTGGQILDPAVYAKIINDRHFKRLMNLIMDAVSKGAVIAFGGGADEASKTIAPTILTHLPEDSEIMRTEIFGPVLPVITYTSLNDVIDRLNKESKPLALYIFSDNKKNIQHLITNTNAGGTCVNDVLIHISSPKLPFGGVNGSGFGSYHGLFGFKSFSHERTVVFQSPLNITGIIYPPYKGKDWILKWLKKMM